MEHTELSPKVEALYQAVMDFFEKGADLGSLTVSEIAARAGIGKGTVYEYFSNKEEMIARALYHKLQGFCRELEEMLEQENSLYDKMQRILQSMEQQMSKSSCFLQLLQMKSSSSEVGRRLQELLQESAKEDMLIIGVIRRMIEKEVRPQLCRDEAGMVYLTMLVFSKIICYGMYREEYAERSDADRTRVKALLSRGICDEIKHYEESGLWESVIS